MHKLETDEREAQNIQQVDVSAMKHVKTGNPLFGWTANDWPLEVPPDNLSPAPSTGLSINIFVKRVFFKKMVNYRANVLVHSIVYNFTK